MIVHKLHINHCISNTNTRSTHHANDNKRILKSIEIITILNSLCYKNNQLFTYKQTKLIVDYIILEKNYLQKRTH